jgi:hypothetical protein
MAAGHRYGEYRETRSGRHADGGNQPDRRSGGEAANNVLPDRYHAAADEADPGDDLSRNARRVDDDSVRLEDIGEAIFGHKYDQRR